MRTGESSLLRRVLSAPAISSGTFQRHLSSGNSFVSTRTSCERPDAEAFAEARMTVRPSSLTRLYSVAFLYLPTVQARQPAGKASPGSPHENWVTEVMTTTRSGERSIIGQPESSASAAMAGGRAILARRARLGESPASDSSLTGCGDCLLGRRTLETVRELRAKDVDRALVGSDELSVARRGCRIELIDRGVLDKQMRVPEVERTVLRQLVLTANR